MSEYRPGNVPPTAEQLPAYLEQELRNLASAMCVPAMQMQLATRHVPPPRMSDGTLVLADGVDWNPGSGAGYYGFRAGAWHFLG